MSLHSNNTDLFGRPTPEEAAKPLVPDDSELQVYLNHLVDNEVDSSGAKALSQILREKNVYHAIPDEQIEFLISIICHEEIPELYPETLSTPEMSEIMSAFVRTFGLAGQNFLAIACSETMVEILQARKEILEKIDEELDRLLPWREELMEHKEELLEEKRFAGVEKEEWEREWAVYKEHLGEFSTMYNEIAPKEKELQGMEKHIRRAETLAVRSLEGFGNTRSGRK